jgi:hypothetical protein
MPFKTKLHAVHAGPSLLLLLLNLSTSSRPTDSLSSLNSNLLIALEASVTTVAMEVSKLVPSTTLPLTTSCPRPLTPTREKTRPANITAEATLELRLPQTNR